VRHPEEPPEGNVVGQLRNFVRDGRLLSIPTRHAKRLVVLGWLAQRFVPGQVYPESEVNAMLSTAHPDYAALRRYLVDEDFLDRRQGKYWAHRGNVRRRRR
jgi:hypothetical protein